MTSVPTDPNLPVWMKRAMRRTDWGVLMALVFSLTAGWSFLFQPGMFLMNANENYLFRAADYARSLADGRLYPRWSPDVVDGYGAPIPHYAPPAAGYLPAVIQLVLTGDPLHAVRIVYLLAFIVAGTTTYALVTRRMNAGSGLIAAVLYVHSPYLALTAPHLLGALPDMLALALLPALLWSMDRLVLLDAPADLLLIAVISGLLLMTDPVIAAAALILALIWLTAHEFRRPLNIVKPLAGVGFGVLIAAVYWLPALVEGDVVRWIERAAEPRPLIDPAALITPLQTLDPGALIPLPQFTLGLASLAAVLASLPAIVRGKAPLHGLFLVLTAATVALMIAAPAETWLLGIAAFTLAISGSVVGRRDTAGKRAASLALPVTLAALLALSFPVWFAPRTFDIALDTSAEAQRRYEDLGYGIAVLPPDEALPTTLPDNLSALSTPGSKIPLDQPGGQFGVLSHATHGDVFQIALNAPTLLHILTTYIPGWHASFRGEAVRVMPHPEGGLMINLPTPDRGELAVWLGVTPPRVMGWLITLVTFGLLMVMTSWRARVPGVYLEADSLTLSESRLCAALWVGLVLILMLFSSGIYDPPRGYTLADSAAIGAQTDAGLELLAYSVERADRRVTLALHWAATRFLPENYQVQVTLIDTATGQTVLAGSPRHPGGYPTRRWRTNLYVTDTHQFDLPGTGSYAAQVEVLTPAGTRITFFAPDGSAFGGELVLPISAN